MTETNQSLGERTILVAPDDARARELTSELGRCGARVLAWPQIEIVEPDSYAALDEAIQNLFGYDWLIFANVNAASFFLRRLQHLGHEMSELDALRVCALDDATRQQLEESHVHVDLVPEKLATEGVMAALETYIGGRNALRGLNFLLPRAAISRDYLPPALEDAGARVDVVSAYRTASNNSELIQLNALVAGGGIDCIAFTTPSSVRAFSQLFDANDLSRLLKEVAVACADDNTVQTVEEYGLRANVSAVAFAADGLVKGIESHFSQ
ncbi:MAG TPA: uroporphyrinogen-III synthase [Pyrinomonadaceae bacterium]|nr:uroporphyrinogen-III synthase [Pyrinomonadaceae bacterium]